MLVPNNSLGRGSIAGDEYIYDMEQARLRKDGTIDPRQILASRSSESPLARRLSYHCSAGSAGLRHAHRSSWIPEHLRPGVNLGDDYATCPYVCPITHPHPGDDAGMTPKKHPLPESGSPVHAAMRAYLTPITNLYVVTKRAEGKHCDKAANPQITIQDRVRCQNGPRANLDISPAFRKRMDDAYKRAAPVEYGVDAFNLGLGIRHCTHKLILRLNPVVCHRAQHGEINAVACEGVGFAIEEPLHPPSRSIRVASVAQPNTSRPNAPAPMITRFFLIDSWFWRALRIRTPTECISRGCLICLTAPHHCKRNVLNTR